MLFCYFHLMPYIHMPEDYLEKHDSSWATLPNHYYNPELGHELYNAYLDILERADELGFDAICVNEHHQTCYGLMPAPNIIAAALARRTSRAKIAILGNAINLRNHPLRVAEEVAMLDVITQGRIISGVVRGIGTEFTAFSMDPTTSRDRFYEALDLIIRAWTEPGPFAFEGKHYNFRCVNTWPRPFQKPYPPIWMPSMGSAETISFAAPKPAPLHPDLQPLLPRQDAPRGVQGGRAEKRIRGRTRAAGLVRPDLRRRDGRDRLERGRATHRLPFQQVPPDDPPPPLSPGLRFRKVDGRGSWGTSSRPRAGGPCRASFWRSE